MSRLLDEVNRLKRKIEDQAHASEKTDAASLRRRAQSDVTALNRFLFQVAAGGLWLYGSVLGPAARFLARPARFVFRLYRGLWDRVVYVEDRFQNRLFSKTRAGGLLAATAFFAWFVFVPLVVFFFDLGLYLATAKVNETVYLTNSQEILPEENVHSVQGCHSLPCTDANSVYFRIRASYFNEAWSLVHGRGLFFPDYVAASVPLSISRCTITSYGVRMKFIMRGMDIYPDLLQTECAPLMDEAAMPEPN